MCIRDSGSPPLVVIVLMKSFYTIASGRRILQEGILITVRKAQPWQAHKRGGSGQGSAIEQDFVLKWKEVHDGSVTDSASRAQYQICQTAQGLTGLRDASVLNKRCV